MKWIKCNFFFQGEFLLQALQQKTIECITEIKKERFQKINEHIIKIENNYRVNDALYDDKTGEVIINLGEDLDDEDDCNEFWADEPIFSSRPMNESSSLSKRENDDNLVQPLLGPSTKL